MKVCEMDELLRINGNNSVLNSCDEMAEFDHVQLGCAENTEEPSLSILLDDQKSQTETARFLEDKWKDKHGPVLVITDKAPELFHFWVLRSDGKTQLSLVNYVLRLFSVYKDFQCKIQELCEINADLIKTVDLINSFLPVTVILLDAKLNPFHLSRQSDNKWISLMGISDYLDEYKVITDMYVQESSFPQTFQTEGLQYYISPAMNDLPGYYYNVMNHEIFAGRIIYCTGNRSAGMESILTFCSLEITKCLKNLGRLQYRSEDEIQVGEALSMILHGKVPEKTLSSVQKYLKTQGDTFQIYLFRPSVRSSSHIILERIKTEFEAMIPGNASIIYNNEIVLIHWFYGYEQDDFHRKMIIFLRENLLIAGCSQPYHDILASRTYYEQASDAILVGSKKNPDYWFFRFADYIGEYVIEQCCSHYLPENFCPTSIKKLQQYDSKHANSELEKTLRAYIFSKFNGSKTAEILHIHKTTFFYRLSKIKELTAIDFDKTDELFPIVFYFQIVPSR